jgi:DNA-binding XRE family transcriptional regulator/quercetin dioxygenase-like cupin family protein
VNDEGVPPIGQRLREARVERGMSVRGLARAVDVSASLISQIETGKSSPSVSTLYAITTALRISIEDVFGDPVAPAGARATAGGALVPSGSLVAAGEVASGGVIPPGAIPAVPSVAPAASTVASGSPAGVALAGAALAGAAVADAAVAVPAPTQAPVGDVAAASRSQRIMASQRRVGPVVRHTEREVLHLDSGVTWELLGQLPHTHVDFLRITYAPGGSSSGAGVLMRHSGTEYGHVLSGRLTLTLGFETTELGPGDSVSFDCSTPHAYANHGAEPAVGVWWVLERYR